MNSIICKRSKKTEVYSQTKMQISKYHLVAISQRRLLFSIVLPKRLILLELCNESMAEALHIDLSTKQKSPGPVLLYVHVCLRSTIKSAYSAVIRQYEKI